MDRFTALKTSVSAYLIDHLHLFANSRRLNPETSTFMKGVVFVAVEICSILNTVLAVAETLIRGLFALIAYPFIKFEILSDPGYIEAGSKVSLEAVKASARTIFQNCKAPNELGPKFGSVVATTLYGPQGLLQLIQL